MQSASSAGVVVREEVRASTAARIAYRPDIDGLRAISVLAVILFHSAVPGFSGGYVGVDVFFVISGYLITQVLMVSPERSLGGRLREFYVRRCRRILPALLVMLVATVAVACWLFLPGDLPHFGAVLGATSVFAGNVVAWQSGGYFEMHDPFNPLAHLWSLAVEEQFYIVFPLFFLASGKARSGRQLTLIASCALASFALCVWASYTHPRANFFLAPTRGWELLLGSLVALGLGRSLSTHPLRGVVSGAALLALLGCVIGYNGSLPYPGLYALVPCGSAALLLAAGAGARGPRVGRWLGTPALVFVGLISYSLYLWHLPILAFAAYYNILPLEPRHIVALLASIFVLATISWRYVEAPLRGRTVLASDARFLATAGAATLGVAALGVFFWQSGDRVGRLDAADAKLIGTTVERLRSDAVACARRTLRDVASGSLCTFGPVSGARADVLVWGDSHAIALLPAYEQIATARNVRLHAAVHSACRPLLPAPITNGKSARSDCGDFNAAVVDAIDKIEPALVILNAFWMYPDGVIDAAGDVGAKGDAHAFEAALDTTLRAIGARRKVCVLGDVPELKYRMPYAYVIARRRGIDPGVITLPSGDADRQLGRVNAYFEELRQRRAFVFVDLKKALCTGSTCALLNADGQSLYRDDNHLSVAGAELLRPSVESCFDGIE
jgi:peptidoglycan/LPS O-acetylase OafA/YrhL